MNSEEVTRIFQAVKPHCIALSQSVFPLTQPISNSEIEPAVSPLQLSRDLVSLLDAFQKAVEGSGSSPESPMRLTTQLGDYIFVPIAHLLSTELTQLDDLLTSYVLQLLTLLIRHCWGATDSGILVPLARQLFPLIVILTGGPPPAPGASSKEDDAIQTKLIRDEKSGELKASGVACLSELFTALNSPSGTTFLNHEDSSQPLLPVVGHAATVLLTIMATSTHTSQLELMLNSTACLRLLYFLVIATGENRRGGDMLSLVLPKTVSVIARLITTSSIKLHYTAVEKLLGLLKDLLALVFDDAVFERQAGPKRLASLDELRDTQDVSVIALSLDETTETSKPFTTPRDEMWLKGNSDRIHKVLATVFRHYQKLFNEQEVHMLQSSAKFTVISKALTSLVESIFQNNFSSLNACIGESIDMWVYLRLATHELGPSDFLPSSFIQSSGKTTQTRDIMYTRLTNFWVPQLSVQIFHSNSDNSREVNAMDVIAFYLKSLQGLIFAGADRDDIRYQARRFSLALENIRSVVFEELSNLVQQSNRSSKKADTQIVTTVKDYYRTNELLALHQETVLTEMEGSTTLPIFNAIAMTENKEASIRRLLNVIGGLIKKATIDNVDGECAEEIMGSVIESLVVDDNDRGHTKQSLGLWMLNHLMDGMAEPSNAELQLQPFVDDFLCFDEVDELSSYLDSSLLRALDDALYTILEVSISTLEDLSLLQNTSMPIAGSSLESLLSQCIALEAIANVCRHLAVEEFKPHLMSLLFPVIDCLSHSDSSVQRHAMHTLQRIAAKCYPDGTVVDLIEDNADYLTDAISLKLSLTAITPSLSKILLVLIKIGKMDLISHLNDLINSMFLLLDMYHGYALLSEGFFMVFQEIIDQVHEKYPLEAEGARDGREELELKLKLHRPWGIKNIDGLIGMLEYKDQQLDEILNPDQEESGKKFANHPGKPFKEASSLSDDKLREVDSDDEEDGLESMWNREEADDTAGGGSNEDEEWDSPLPEKIYYMVQRVFNYGIRLLNHPSVNLQNQILTIYKSLIPVLATSPRRLLPVLADSWPVLYASFQATDDLRLIVPLCNAFEQVFQHGGSFMASRFVALWPLIKQKSVIQQVYSRISLMPLQRETVLGTPHQLVLNIPNYNLRTYECMVKVLVTGLRECGQQVPDPVVNEIIHLCIPCMDNSNGTNLSDASFGELFTETAWFIRTKIYGMNNADLSVNVPPDFVGGGSGKVYHFQVPLF
ncbi:hypothetical protein BABINDRAFT_111523 [Babjeviella inositovora NRRL Y-12698]|uniref:Uncharacterized protein n=1 Tax=Babjeviella inositovora NRRL Y-12698 TaxID=984486 RepID=A0A1E3QVU4_9ASCO|nr:uncharacterized protein BABINDRAFT_111523 [Babjeviella inositovora NRRL Y-12698]ODQ81785.1 hypothetical protein BABINDRAFT_111523 [Babjeviella inositovora NRRL Y-12698]